LSEFNVAKMVRGVGFPPNFARASHKREQRKSYCYHVRGDRVYTMWDNDFTGSDF